MERTLVQRIGVETARALNAHGFPIVIAVAADVVDDRAPRGEIAQRLFGRDVGYGAQHTRPHPHPYVENRIEYDADDDDGCDHATHRLIAVRDRAEHVAADVSGSEVGADV